MSPLRIIQHPRKGRSVVATEWLKSGRILDTASVQPLKKKLNWNDPLYDFVFEWAHKPYVEAIAFGIVSMINHSGTPNCSIKCNYDQRTITLRAIKDILPHQELSFDYGVVWFAEAI